MYKSQLRWQVKQEKRKREFAFFIITVPLLIYLLWVFFLGDGGYFHYIHLMKERNNLVYQVAKLQKETMALKKEITSLESDPFYIEKHAREDLNLSRPDEYIFLFDD